MSTPESLNSTDSGSDAHEESELQIRNDSAVSRSDERPAVSSDFTSPRSQSLASFMATSFIAVGTVAAKAERKNGDDDSASDDAKQRSTTAKHSGEYDEHGIALPIEVVQSYAEQRLVRASNAASLSKRVALVLDPDVTRLRDNDAVSMAMRGVPSHQRRSVWLAATGVEVRMVTERAHYRHLLKRLRSEQRHAVPTTVYEQIEKDLDRTTGITSPDCDRERMRKRLLRILMLYSMHAERDGYAQGLNFVAMSFVVLNFTDEEAFWMMVHVTTNLFPMSFDQCVIGQHADVAAFTYYFKKTFPVFNRWLEAHDLDVKMVCATVMFGTLLCDRMPYESVWCVWDLMFVGGAIEFFTALLQIMTFVIDRLPRKTVIERPSSPPPLPPPPSIKQRFMLWRKQSEDDAQPPSSSLPAAVAPVEASVDQNAPVRTDFALDSCSVIIKVNSLIRSIVDMPGLLATTVLARTIDPRALQLRRNRNRMFFYNTIALPMLEAHARRASSCGASVATPREILTTTSKIDPLIEQDVHKDDSSPSGSSFALSL